MITKSVDNRFKFIDSLTKTPLEELTLHIKSLEKEGVTYMFSKEFKNLYYAHLMSIRKERRFRRTINKILKETSIPFSGVVSCE